MKRQIAAALVIVGSLTASVSAARAVTYTGAELYSNPDVTFPSVSPSISGTGLYFPTGSGGLVGQLLLPLSAADGYQISVDLTRGSDGDFDPHIMIGDGTSYLGAVYADNGGGGLAASCTVADCNSTRSLVNLFSSVNVPANGSLIMDLSFTFGTSSTTLMLTLSGDTSGSGSYIFGTALDRNNLTFAILDDNDPNGPYRLNSLSVTPVPIPAALPLLMSALGFFGFMGWRRKQVAACNA